jgi:hypothetical protein
LPPCILSDSNRKEQDYKPKQFEYTEKEFEYPKFLDSVRNYLKKEYSQGKGFWHYFVSFCKWFSLYVPAPSSIILKITHLANPFNNKDKDNNTHRYFPIHREGVKEKPKKDDKR